MTRKHFQALAEELKFVRPALYAEDGEQLESMRLQWQRDIIAVADACAEFNARFDRSRFYRAAGLEG